MNVVRYGRLHVYKLIVDSRRDSYKSKFQKLFQVALARDIFLDMNSVNSTFRRYRFKNIADVVTTVLGIMKFSTVVQ